MSSNRKYTMPTKQALDNAYKWLNHLSDHMLELNNMYLEQAKAFWSTNIADSQGLYEVSTPEEYIRKISSILIKNGALVTKTFMEDLNMMLKISAGLTNCTVCGSDGLQAEALKFYEFYSKLIPNPFSCKIDELVKSAVVGNQDSIHALHKVVENTASHLGFAAESGANTVLSTLDKLNKRSRTVNKN